MVHIVLIDDQLVETELGKRTGGGGGHVSNRAEYRTMYAALRCQQMRMPCQTFCEEREDLG